MSERDGPAPRRPETVMVCINRRFRSDRPSCAARGSEAIADAIETGVSERGLNIRVEKVICLGQCNNGPTVRFAPGGRFNLETGLADVPAILDEIERLCGRADDDDGPPVHLLGS